MKLKRQSTGNAAAIESREIASNWRSLLLYSRLIAAAAAAYDSQTFTAALVSATAGYRYTTLGM